MDALAADEPRAAASSASPHKRARVAGAVQGVSDPGRRALGDRAAVRGAEPGAGRPGEARGGLALVERGCAPEQGAAGVAGGRPGGAAASLATLGERTVDGTGVGGCAAKRGSGDAVGRGVVDGGDGKAAGAGIRAPPPWPTSQGGEKVACPLFPVAENEISRVAFAVAAAALALIVSSCIGPADTIRKYMQMVEIAVTDLEGRPATGVQVYHYDWPVSGKGPDGQKLFDSAAREAALQRNRPELLRGVNHQTDASGRAVIPVFDAWIISMFPLIGPVPRKPDQKGMAGKVCIIAVDDGVNADEISVQMLPGSSGKGECWRVEIRSLSTPQEYGLFDDHPLE